MKEIHLKAPRGWINDPNGFIYYKGEYHLFYQHFPYAPVWGRMHWGHAVSRDLTNWEHKEIALFPTKTDDCDGCWSGSAVEADGQMYLFYTGVRYSSYNPENVNQCSGRLTAAQLHISSEDGHFFDNLKGKSTVIPPIADPSIGDSMDTRDPKVRRGKNGKWFIILGSTVEGKGRFLFYSSDDLKTWEYRNFSPDDCGFMVECPDYFEIDKCNAARGAEKQGVVIYSPIPFSGVQQAMWRFAEFDENTCEMRLTSPARLFDYGLDLYAPQSAVDEAGRRIVVAWLRMFAPMKNGAIGMFSSPRVCEMRNGKLYFAPHPNIQKAFSVKTTSPNGAYKVKTSLFEGQTLNVGGYIIRRESGRIIADRSGVNCGHTEVQNVFETPEIEDGNELEIYVDENIAEVFVNGGEYVITNAVYGLTDEVTGGVNTEIYVMA